MKIAVALTAVALVAGTAWAVLVGPLRDPKAAMDDFLAARGRGEGQLTDRLVLAGPRVRPVVLAAVADRDLKLRRYALGFLGCSDYRSAQDALRGIVGSGAEQDYFRADALEALWRLDRAEGEVLARRYQEHPDYLGEKARELINTGPLVDGRSWLDALAGRHG